MIKTSLDDCKYTTHRGPICRLFEHVLGHTWPYYPGDNAIARSSIAPLCINFKPSLTFSLFNLQSNGAEVGEFYFFYKIAPGEKLKRRLGTFLAQALPHSLSLSVFLCAENREKVIKRHSNSLLFLVKGIRNVPILCSL